MWRRWATWSLLVSSMAVVNEGCREATQVEVRVLTDVPCAEQKGVAWWVGPKGGGELAPHTDKQVWCRGSDVGAFVVVPSGEKDAAFDIRVVMGVGVDVEQCKGPDWKGCIVARRSTRFEPHVLQTVRVDLRRECLSVACDGVSTCVAGRRCRRAEIEGDGDCGGDGEECGEGALGPEVDGLPVTDGGGGSAGTAGMVGFPVSRTVFVSPFGEDKNTGTDGARPKRTIAAALKSAKMEAETGWTVAVCEGLYNESVVLDAPVAIKGGFDCASWVRNNPVYPDFAVGAKTILQPNSGPTATLVIKGAHITPDVEVSGLILVGPDMVDGSDQLETPASAVLIQDGASPHITQNIIRGGESSSTGDLGSAGLAIWSTSTLVEITKNRIEGGAGQAKGRGSVGVVYHRVSGSPRFSFNTVDGGTGKATGEGGVGSTGLLALFSENISGPSALTDSTFSGGRGTGHNGSWGLAVDGNTRHVELRRSVVLGGEGRSTSQLGGNNGVYVGFADRVDLDSCRIYGGDELGAGTTTGVVSLASKALNASNSIVHGGNGAPSAAGARSTGMFVVGATTRLLHNSVFAGKHGVYGGSAISYNGGGGLGASAPASMVLKNNLLMGSESDAALVVHSCAPHPEFDELSGNVVIGFNTIMYREVLVSGECDGSKLETTRMDELEGQFGAGESARAVRNLFLRDVCGSDSSCQPFSVCGVQTVLCLQQATAGWGTATWGATNVTDEGWRFREGIPCAVSVLASPAGLTTDIQGIPRSTKTPTPGAFERRDWTGCSP